MELEAIVARLPVGQSGTVIGFAPGLVGINPGAPRWLRLTDGAEVPAPEDSDPEFTAWTDGHRGLTAPPLSELPIELDAYLQRTQPAGDAMLLDTASLKFERRALQWLVGSRLFPARKAVADGARAEVIGRGEAVLFDPEARRLELFSIDDPKGVALTVPSFLCSNASAGASRLLVARPAEDALIFDLGTALAWLRLSTLREASNADEVRWVFKQVVPGAVDESRQFEVVFAGPSVVLLQAGSERVTLKVDGSCLVKGTQVTLHRRLWATGMPQYAELEHRGVRRSVAPFAELEPEVLPVKRGGPAPARSRARTRWRALVDAIRQLGLLNRLEPADRDELLEGLENEPVDAELLLATYYGADDSRMRADGVFTHDHRFASDEVLSQLAELAGRPLLTLVEERFDPEHEHRLVRLQQPSGAVIEQRISYLGELVDLFNAELARISDARRFRLLTPNGDEYRYILVTETQRKKLERWIGEIQ